MPATVSLSAYRPALGDVAAAAAAVAAVASEHAAESEQGRRLAAPVVDAFVASGLAGLAAPTELGGAGAPIRELVEAIEAISAGDASAGWCAAIAIGTNHFAGRVPEASARAVFTAVERPGSSTFAPGGRAVPTPGGYRVDGRWSFASGCHHAATLACGVMVAGPDGRPQVGPDGAPIVQLAVVPAEGLEIDETWDTVGLTGTGSHDIRLTGVEIDAGQLISFGARSWSADALFRLTLFDVFGPIMGAVALGIGRAALDHFLALAQAEHAAGGRPGPKAAFGDDPFGQAALGHAEVRLRSSRALLLELVDEAYDRAAMGTPVPRAHTALVGLAARDTIEAAAAAVDAAGRLSGTSSIRTGSLHEKLRRDLDTMRRHTMFDANRSAPLGRQVAGIPTVAFPFLLPD